jgi:exodeoxyribonuclease V beta subunit
VDFRSLEGAEKALVDGVVCLEKDAERLRLIYVALTRAVHRCYVVVGPYKQGQGTTACKESRGNPLHWLFAPGDSGTPQAWREAPPEWEAVAAAIGAFATAAAPAVVVQELADIASAALPAQSAPAGDIAALPAPAHIPFGWQTGSYSSLAHGASHERAAADRDARADAADRWVVPRGLGDDDFLRFPRGARAGELVHAVFEAIDFTRDDTVPPAVERALRRMPPSTELAQPVLARMLHGMVRQVLATPLHEGFALRTLGAADRVTELEFSMASPSLRAHAIAQAMQAHGYPPPVLSVERMQGYLRGFIDLVYRHGGRYHLLDWKTNHLGFSPDGYAPAALRQAMTAQGYHLQSLLYTVALHRWLRSRLRGYDYDRHVGGVRYLFVRGMREGWTDADGAPLGVHADRPPRELVEALDAAIGCLKEPA